MGRNLDAQRRASTSKAPERWGGFLSWVVRLTFHAGRPEPGTRRHTGTQAAGPPPPRSSPASSHAPWPRPQIGRPGLVQQTFRARREHAATALSPPASEALPRTSGIMSHDPSCDWTVFPPPCLFRPTSYPQHLLPTSWLRYVGESGAPAVGFRCYTTWDDPPPDKEHTSFRSWGRWAGHGGLGPSVAVQKPVPGQIRGLYTRQPAARVPWNRGAWSPELLSPEQFPLIPELHC